MTDSPSDSEVVLALGGAGGALRSRRDIRRRRFASLWRTFEQVLPGVGVGFHTVSLGSCVDLGVVGGTVTGVAFGVVSTTLALA